MNVVVLPLARDGQVFVTRDAGREVAGELDAAFTNGENVVLSFIGVEMVTPSFLDEVFTRARGHLGRPDHPLLLAIGANEDIAETLELVLRHQNLMLPVIEDDQVELLGGSEQLQETLDAAVRLREFTPKDLAEELGLKLPALHQRLHALTRAGAVNKRKDVKRGKSEVWAAPDLHELKQFTPA